MHLEHLALWTTDLERCQQFYVTYFGAKAGPRYVNRAKGFESCFLSFTSGARLEIMKSTSLPLLTLEPGAQCLGFVHAAFSVGSEPLVDELTQKLRQDGFSVLDGPRRTGDGYYESVVLDPDGNRIEITA